MRFRFKSNVARFFVVALLLSAVACSELPELAKLMDRTSNDFTPPSYVVGEIDSAVAAQVTTTTAAPEMRARPAQNSPDVPRQTRLFRCSRELLLFYSILRT